MYNNDSYDDTNVDFERNNVMKNGFYNGWTIGRAFV
jgi:hypothetical protein